MIAPPRVGGAERLALRAVLFVCFLGALGVDDYFPRSILQEAIGALTLFAAFALAIVTRLPGERWVTLLILPLAAIAATALLYAFVFSQARGAPLLPSLLAQRFYVFYLLGPLVLLAWRAGAPQEEIEASFIAALYAAGFVYVVCYLALPLALYAESAEPTLRRLVQVDDWRGVRLKGPMFVFLLLFALEARRLLRPRGALPLLATLVALLGLLALFLVNVPRAHLAALAIAGALWPLFFAGPKRFRMGLAIAPLFATLGAALLFLVWDDVARTFEADPSFRVRMQTAYYALQTIGERPLLGIGQASYRSTSYHDLYGTNFYPSDIGMLGVWFRYGLVGVVGYVALGVTLLWGAARLAHRPGAPALHKALLFTLVVMHVISATSPILISREGIAVAGLCFGLMAIDAERRRRGRR